MKQPGILFSFCALVSIVAWSCSSPQPALVSLEQRVKRLEAAAPGVGELMSGVHLHFAKLHYAAKAGNWKLADSEVDEIQENLDKAALLRPEENGVKLAGVIESLKQTQLAGMKKASAQGERSLFSKSYDETMSACNSCHRTTGRPFIVITEPTAPPVANQQWASPKEN